MIEGLLHALTPINMLMLTIGVAGGVLIGCLPGLTATMGTAILVPFTFVLDPAAGLITLGGLYVGAMFGDAVPSILVNVPGTPAAMATALDGFPMTRQGRSAEALVTACLGSAVGAVVGGIALLTIAPPLARAALAFGPPEFFWLGVFALTIMGSVVGDSFLRGLGGGLFGLLMGMVGIAAAGATARFTFGFYQVSAGIVLPVALIGLFAIPQLISLAENRKQRPEVAKYEHKPRLLRLVAPIVLRPVGLLRSSVIGTFVGILPGAGAPLAAILSYNEAMRWSKDRSQFGKGDIRGVAASETANNASAPAEMVPLLTLGIPGSNVAAILLGALLFHGLRPGAALFRDTPDIVYAFIWSLMLAGIVVFVLGRIMTPALAQVVRAPVYALVPAIAALTVIGSFAMRNIMFDVYLMMFLGIAGYFLVKMKIPVPAVALGLILGPIVDDALDTSLRLARSAGFFNVFFTRPISIMLILLTVLAIAWQVYSRLAARQAQVSADEVPAGVGAGEGSPGGQSEREAPGATREAGDGDVERARAGAREAPPEGRERRRSGRGWHAWGSGSRHLLNYDTYSGSALVAIGMVAHWQSGPWDHRAWMFPRGVATAMVVLGMALLIIGILRNERERLFDSWSAARDAAGFTATVVAFFLLVPRLGYFYASWLFVFALALALRGRASVVSGIVVFAASGVGIGLLYLIFAEAFNVPLPTGRWF